MQQLQRFIYPNYSQHVWKLKKEPLLSSTSPKAMIFRFTDQLHQLGFKGYKGWHVSLYSFLRHNPYNHPHLYGWYNCCLLGHQSHWSFYKLSMIFPVKGLRSFFLVVETLRDGHDLFLTQREYIADLLRKADLDKVKPCPTSVIFLNSKVLISVTLNSI